MSTSIILLFQFIGKQIMIYGGITNLIGGILGGLLNIIVFISLKTFQQNSCAFYLMIMSGFNIGQLFADLLPRIMLIIYNTDGTDISLFYCKIRLYIANIFTMFSLTCFCLTTIDQYFATCSYRRLQQLCNIKLAKRLIIITSIIWILHAIPYIIFFEHIVSSNTGKVTCIMSNTIYIQYRTYFIVLILFGILPFSFSVLFGLLAFRNIQKLVHYTIPLVRRELDKQLTIMVLVQVLVNFFTLLPYTVTNIISLNMKYNLDPFAQAQIQLSANITQILYYIYYSTPFYVYVCVSKRFRRQLIYVLFKIHLNRWRPQPIMNINQIVPYS